MTMKNVMQDTGLPVRVALAKARKSGREISEKTGIPYGSLLRKLDGDAPFSLDNLLEIAVALGVHPAELLPENFKHNHNQRSVA